MRAPGNTLSRVFSYPSPSPVLAGEPVRKIPRGLALLALEGHQSGVGIREKRLFGQPGGGRMILPRWYPMRNLLFLQLEKRSDPKR